MVKSALEPRKATKAASAKSRFIKSGSTAEEKAAYEQRADGTQTRRFTLRMTSELSDRFRAYCTEIDKPWNTEIEQAIEEYLHRKGK
jgi:hypothetical protein